MKEQKLEQEPKNNKTFIMVVVILSFVILVAGVYWSLQKDGNSKNNLTSLFQKKQQENKSLGWATYVSDDQYFRMNYPDNWKVLDDESLYFGAVLYNEDQDTEALIKVRKIEAINKVGLQEILDDEYKTCTEEREDCSVVDIEKLTVIKISGEKSRIDTDSKYLSGTTIYVYLQDYYLAVYLEYKDEAYLPTFEKIVDSIFIDIESKYKHYYCNREPGTVPIFTDKDRFTAYCHKVVEEDTLWSIAETYYGDPHLWGQLKIYDNEKNYDLSRVSPDDPKALSPGIELVLWDSLQFSNDDKTTGGIVEGFGLDTDTGDLFTTNRQHIYINNDIYDQDFGSLWAFFIDEKTNNKIYIVSPKAEEGESGRQNNGWIFQFVFNKQRNPYVGPGASFELLVFNHDEDKYALRTNVRQGVPDPGFMVLSNIGNGSEYDYLDSIIWYDNDTLIYRAQNNDEWRLVINNQDYKTYNYIENLRVEDGVIKFDVRDEKGEWSKKEIVLDDDQYNAELFLIPNVPPVGDEFFTYLKNSRSDLSEADLFRIEKNYHYKKGTLVDEFGNLIEDPVKIYLDPVPGIGMSEDIGRLTFTAEKGSFELFVKDIGPYTLSLQEGWLSDDLVEINPVDFRYQEKQADHRNLNKEYKITVSNIEYDKKAREKYTYAAEAGDTLWSFTERYYKQGYYWPLIVENNDLNSGDGMPVISEGDELYTPPLTHFSSIEELDGLRKKFHEENKEETITLENTEFSYSINYPKCWEIGKVITKEYNENAPYYDMDIHEQWIMGPEYPNLPGKGRRPWLIIKVHDNRDGMSVEEFAVKNRITDQEFVDDGTFMTEEREGGGISFAFYGELRHLVFFKDDLIYDVSYVSHPSVDSTSKQEMLDMVDSFKFID